MKDFGIEKVKKDLMQTILKLDQTIWEGRGQKPIDEWLENFENENEKINALYLLSRFHYFGSQQMRELLRVLFRDLYKYRKISEIRKSNKNTTDLNIINEKFEDELKKTRFLGVGNPSESGVHLLYFFRQENKLPKNLFVETFKLLGNDPDLDDVKEYVFIDDFCGSGSQAKVYSKEIVDKIKEKKPNIKISYLMLFATTDGKNNIQNLNKFDFVETVFELDESFKCFSEVSRYFQNVPKCISKNESKLLSDKYGYNIQMKIWEKESKKPKKQTIQELANRDKSGYCDCQLLLGFHHNTPNNSLPIFWYDEGDIPWVPIFKRYNKIY